MQLDKTTEQQGFQTLVTSWTSKSLVFGVTQAKPSVVVSPKDVLSCRNKHRPTNLKAGFGYLGGNKGKKEDKNTPYNVGVGQQKLIDTRSLIATLHHAVTTDGKVKYKQSKSRYDG